MKSHLLPAALLVFGVLLADSSLQAGARKSASASWQAADSWFLEIEQFSRKEPNDVLLGRYKLGALVSGKDTVGTIDCWNVAFLPGEDMPPGLANHYYVSVAKDAGWPLKIVHTRVFKRVPEPVLAASVIGLGRPFNSLGIVGATPILKIGHIKPAEQIGWLERFDKISFITAAPEGYPIEIIPLFEPGQFSSAKSGATLALRNQKEGEYLVLEAVVKVGQTDKLLIRQKWIEGEKWWREYERYVNGRKDLAARRVMPPQVNAEPPVDPKTDPLYLLRDSKLQVVIEIEERGAKLPVLFERIRKATGLLLTVDSSLADHQPDLGSIQPSKQGYRACNVMGIIERSQLENGRWLKTANGYKLTGVSKVPRPITLPEDGVPPAAPGAPAPSGLKAWGIGGLVAGGITLMGLGGLFVLRRSRRTLAKPAENKKSQSK